MFDKLQLHHYLSSIVISNPFRYSADWAVSARRNILYRSSAYRSRYNRGLSSSTKPSPIPFSTQGLRLHDTTGLAEGDFTFLNREVHLGVPVDWFPSSESQLWLYNLHLLRLRRLAGGEVPPRSRREHLHAVS